MTTARFLAPLALLALLAALPAHAQTQQEIITDVVLQAADAWDRARQAKEARWQEAQRAAQARVEDEQHRREQRDKESEQRRKQELAAIRQWPGLGSLTPPLEAGEVYGETENGCGIVMKGDGSKKITSLKYGADGKYLVDSAGKAVTEQIPVRDFIRGMVWSGDCSNGLAHGLGAFSRRADLPKTIDYKHEYAYGRRLSRMLKRNHAGDLEIAYMGDQKLHISIPAWREPYKPRFGKWMLGGLTELNYMELGELPRSTTARAEVQSCTQLDKKPRGCSYENNFDVFVVSLMTIAEGKPTTTTTPCPDPRTTENCQGVWQQVAGPLIAKIQANVALADANDKQRRTHLASLNSIHLLNLRVQTLAREAESKKDAERRQAAAREAAQVAETAHKAKLAKKQAAQQKAEREFKTKLATLNAGQLFVLADELRSTGKTAQARDTLRALISRFPDHALAANAASALATLR